MRLLIMLLGSVLLAQDDSKLSVHTLVREDIFAGLIAGDMATNARGYAKLQELKKTHAAEMPVIEAWESSVLLLRAANALRDGQPAAAQQLYAQGFSMQKRALEAAPHDIGVNAVVGGTGALVADRLAPAERQQQWNQSFACYKTLHKLQQPVLDKLPVHNRGEVLTGLVMGAERTGDTAAFERFLAIAQDSLKNTAYSSLLLKWQQDPGLRARSNITCKTCHEPGKLENMRRP